MSENELSKITLDCCFKIHSELGPGLLESIYEEILCYELTRTGLNYERQKEVSTIYQNINFGIGFRADLILENKLILELKSVEEIRSVHKKQLLTYLKLTNLKLGLLINFNEALLKDGITRIANNL
ncbi:MAG TPA: GxxExxY protein [Ignavibacteria bacterium]|nr:GxxExxY protein [Ignavibacteria bacterium]